MNRWSLLTILMIFGFSQASLALTPPKHLIKKHFTSHQVKSLSFAKPTIAQHQLAFAKPNKNTIIDLEGDGLISISSKSPGIHHPNFDIGELITQQQTNSATEIVESDGEIFLSGDEQETPKRQKKKQKQRQLIKIQTSQVMLACRP